jgi:hypothetical protein
MPGDDRPIHFPLALRLLDHQIDGPGGAALAKVDDIELELRDTGLVATALLCGPGALGPRLPGRVGLWTTAVWRRLSLDPNPTPIRIPLLAVRDISAVVTVTVEAELAVSRRLTVERWLAEHLVERLPGSRSEPLPVPSPRTRGAVDLSPQEWEQPEVPRLRLSDVLTFSAQVDGREAGTIHEVVAVREQPRSPVVGAMPIVGYVAGGRRSGSTFGYDRHPEHGPWLLRAAMLAWHRHDTRIAQQDLQAFDHVNRRVTARGA